MYFLYFIKKNEYKQYFCKKGFIFYILKSDVHCNASLTSKCTLFKKINKSLFYLQYDVI